MARLFAITGITVCIIFGLLALSFAQNESLTITTYYPSPYGSYADLTAQRMKIGTTYSGAGVGFVANGLIVEGNVGIGTTTPAFKLDVVGDINTSGEIRKSGGGPYTYPDYVFETGYDLLPLGELKKFIAQKRHLPNMPSKEEIKKEGVKIFEQNRLILEKLEEAYLYILKLEERIAKLEKRSAK